jgi:hypothetical protein
VPYVRVTRDERGYETTFLLHVRWPGDRPQVLYWYRTAPGVRVGRPALDEDAIRAIEEQHPEIEFDWEHLIESSTMLPPEVEHRPERPRRKPRPAEVEPVRELRREAESDRGAAATPESPSQDATPEAAPHADPPVAFRPSEPPPRVASPHVHAENALLDQLVGREIAARLRARYAELLTRLSQIDDVDRRADWQARAERLDPDTWQTPEAILDGVQHAERRLEELRRNLDS